jgi:glutamate formiminotransferase
VRNEAGRHGVTVLESEVVGLVPEAALPPDPEHSLRLTGFTHNQVLECRLLETRGTS